jgi:hypothetical protein
MTGQKHVIHYYYSTKMAYNINQNIEINSNQITSSGINFKSLLKTDLHIKSFIIHK